MQEFYARVWNTKEMNLLKSLAAVSSMTMFSRVLGFARDAIVARIFGAGMATDAFFVAFKLPNLLRRIFAEGAFSQAFVPILAEYKSKQGEEATRIFVAYVSGLLTLALAVVTVAGMLAAPWVIMVTAPGFADTADKFALTTQLLRITFPYILLISLASLVGAILNTWNRFSIPAFAPTFLNISMIGFALFAAPYFNPPVLALAWAVTVGGVLQLVYQLPYLKKIGMLVLPRINFRDTGAMRVVKQMGPAILGVSVSQISLIINTIFASFLASGSVSWMYYADRLMEFPSGVLGVALGTILLPSLSKSFASGNHDEYCRLMDWGLRLCFLLALPSAVALGILAKPLTVSLFQYGKFTAFDAAMTQRALIAYSVGLIGLIVVKVLAPGFYSRQDIKNAGENRHSDVNHDSVNEPGVYWTAETCRVVALYWSGGMSQCVAAVLATAQTEYLYATTGLDVVPDASDYFCTGDGRRIVRRVAYYAGVVARVDVMAFAAFDGGSDRGYRGLFRRACRAGL
ncbi:virulence factor MviN [Salmonella enterica subsp. enterica serovar Sanjuan]|uniref:Probable lipid II flippase MurJ n=1 Tax=Salmonella enterica subsp. enterica serovar Sanjuan TaxID=1160765 RepID=A0A447NWK9_SALET|nr:virulence factor MviN [Salmonella enterica subsp. enterica serovar Sanjuan]